MKHDAYFALPATGNGGAFGLSPIKSMQSAYNGMKPNALYTERYSTLMLIATRLKTIAVNRKLSAHQRFHVTRAGESRWEAAAASGYSSRLRTPRGLFCLCGI